MKAAKSNTPYNAPAWLCNATGLFGTCLIGPNPKCQAVSLGYRSRLVALHSEGGWARLLNTTKMLLEFAQPLCKHQTKLTRQNQVEAEGIIVGKAPPTVYVTARTTSGILRKGGGNVHTAGICTTVPKQAEGSPF